MKRAMLLVLWAGLGLFAIQAEAGAPVGKVEFARGGAAAQEKGEGAPRLLGQGSEILEGDVIQTAQESFVILDMQDGGRLTVRPNSRLDIARYRPDQDKAPGEIQLTLHQGGVRAVPGAITQEQKHPFRLETPQGTAQSPGAEFTARLCQKDDCQKESQRAMALAAKLSEKSVGRVIQIHGTVKATVGEVTNTRELYLGSPVFEEDKLTSGADSYAVLQFKDGGKYTLQEKSALAIAEYRASGSEPAAPDDHAFLKLLKGGLRVVTGAIGKTKKEAYRLETAVATMGIRGTRFDLLCQGDCRSEKPPEDQARIEAGEESGLYAVVWEGGISESNQAGSFPVDANQSTFLAQETVAPVYLRQIPGFFLQNAYPSPKDVTAPAAETQAASDGEIEPGLYVESKGAIEFLTGDGRRLAMGGQETVYLGSGQHNLLEGAFEFMMYDNYLPSPFTDNPEVTFSLLRDSLEGTSLVYFCACP